MNDLLHVFVHWTLLPMDWQMPRMLERRASLGCGGNVDCCCRERPRTNSDPDSASLHPHPRRLFRTAELVEWCYPRLTGKIERKHRWESPEKQRRPLRCVFGTTIAGAARRGRGVIWRESPDADRERTGRHGEAEKRPRGKSGGPGALSLEINCQIAGQVTPGSVQQQSSQGEGRGHTPIKCPHARGLYSAPITLEVVPPGACNTSREVMRRAHNFFISPPIVGWPLLTLSRRAPGMVGQGRSVSHYPWDHDEERVREVCIRYSKLPNAMPSNRSVGSFPKAGNGAQQIRLGCSAFLQS